MTRVSISPDQGRVEGVRLHGPPEARARAPHSSGRLPEHPKPPSQSHTSRTRTGRGRLIIRQRPESQSGLISKGVCTMTSVHRYRAVSKQFHKPLDSPRRIPTDPLPDRILAELLALLLRTLDPRHPARRFVLKARDATASSRSTRRRRWRD